MTPIERDLKLLRDLYAESADAEWAGLAAITRTIIRIVRSEPRMLSAFDPSARVLQKDDESLGDLGSWASRAWATLSAVDTEQPPSILKPLLSVQNYGSPITDHLRSRVRTLILFPILLWLEDQVRGLAGFTTAIDRFVARCEWFGLPGHPVAELARIDEPEVQPRLHLWLFDAGFDPADSGREARSAGDLARQGGRMDFALRGVRGVIPVEVKLWRGPSNNRHLRDWAVQAGQYPRDLLADDGYLLIVVTAREDTLDDQLPNHQLLIGGRRIHVRIADLSRRRPSEEGTRTRHPLTLASFGLGGTP